MRHPDHSHLSSSIKVGVSFVWTHRFLRDSSAIGGMANTIGAAVILLAILLAKQGGASPASIGVLSALIGAGGITGAVLAPLMLRLIPHRYIFVGIGWYWTALIPTMAFTTNPYLLGAIGALLTLPFPAWNAATFATATALTPDHLFGRVQSVRQLVSRATTPFGPLSAGLGYSTMGGRATVLTVATAALLMAFVGSASRSLRETTTAGHRFDESDTPLEAV